MNYVTKMYHTIIIKKYQYNYDTISIIFEYKYRQINTNKYSILTNKNSLIKSLNNAKYELHELLNKLYSEKGTFKYKLCAYTKAIKNNSLNTYTIKILSNYFLANNNLNNSVKIINSLFHEYFPKSIDIHQSTRICILLKIKDY